MVKEVVDASKTTNQQYNPRLHIIPPKKSFGQYVYDREAKTILGRTTGSWCKYKYLNTYQKCKPHHPYPSSGMSHKKIPIYRILPFFFLHCKY